MKDETIIWQRAQQHIWYVQGWETSVRVWERFAGVYYVYLPGRPQTSSKDLQSACKLIADWIRQAPEDHPERVPHDDDTPEGWEEIPHEDLVKAEPEAGPAAVTPEPPPTGKGTDASYALIHQLIMDSADNERTGLVMDLVRRRDFGIAKYGTPLRTNNGRDHIKDAYQEALDLMVYLKAASLEGNEVATDLLDDVINLAEVLCP
jgi:hypothetical protein